MDRRPSHPVINYALLALGSAIAAFAVEEFLVPNTILDGGVIGVGMMLSHVTGVPLALLTVILNAPFVILGGIKLGRSFTARAVFSMATFSACVELFDGWANAT
ncbi:MAG: YitT family protein, partial [Parolsenella sp.]|uniref:YitT family protein n=1 Tax=Parolsenella sp. TaxID=2083006 RepID=UPI002A76693B